jgi:hypothetical protein
MDMTKKPLTALQRGVALSGCDNRNRQAGRGISNMASGRIAA